MGTNHSAGKTPISPAQAALLRRLLKNNAPAAIEALIVESAAHAGLGQAAQAAVADIAHNDAMMDFLGATIASYVLELVEDDSSPLYVARQ